MADVKKVFDLKLLLAFYAYKRLKHCNCHRITINEFEKYLLSLKNYLKKNNIEFAVNNGKYIRVTDIINDYPNFFSRTLINGEDGFIIFASISPIDIQRAFFDNYISIVNTYLTPAYEDLFKN